MKSLLLLKIIYVLANLLILSDASQFRLLYDQINGTWGFLVFGSLITFQCQYQSSRPQSLNRHCWVLPYQIPLQLDREGIKERENGEKGGGRGGDYSREAIIQGNTYLSLLIFFIAWIYNWTKHFQSAFSKRYGHFIRTKRGWNDPLLTEQIG